jgi:hypothetical protein
VTVTPAPVRAQGTCTACGRSVRLLPSGTARVSAHGRRVSNNPIITRGRCRGSHQPPKTETTEKP